MFPPRSTPRRAKRAEPARATCIPAALLALLLVLDSNAALAETKTQCIGTNVCIDLFWNDDEVQIDARNRTSFPVGVSVVFEHLKNVTAVPRLGRGREARVVVAPKRQKNVVMLVRQNARKGIQLPFQWTFVYGDPAAKHDDDFLYRMPFGGRETRELSQGANGEFSHKGTSAWSFDFAMPIGTPIVAARAGRVVEISDGYTKSGVSANFLDKANAVTVLHSDGTFATYAHLDAGSGVRPGMHVRVGDVLGFSGNTGFSTGPHLHFSVWKASTAHDGGGVSLPIRFRDPTSGRSVAMIEGRRYAPTCHEGGRRCSADELGEANAGALASPAPASSRFDRQNDGTCRCGNGAVITTKLPCRAVCP